MTVPSNFSTLNNQYINLLDQEIFTIIVGTKNYTCNKYGINSSEVLRDYREKNPNAKFYVYNFGGPHDNFQLICDFFQFSKNKNYNQQYELSTNHCREFKNKFCIN